MRSPIMLRAIMPNNLEASILSIQWQHNAKWKAMNVSTNDTQAFHPPDQNAFFKTGEFSAHPGCKRERANLCPLPDCPAMLASDEFAHNLDRNMWIPKDEKKEVVLLCFAPSKWMNPKTSMRSHLQTLTLRLRCSPDENQCNVCLWDASNQDTRMHVCPVRMV